MVAVLLLQEDACEGFAPQGFEFSSQLTGKLRVRRRLQPPRHCNQ